MTSGFSYNVTVETQPTAYREICAVSNGSGTVAVANVTNVAIQCSTVVGFLYAAMAPNSELLSYGITPGTGSPIAFGAPIATGGTPTAVASSPNGAFLYVGLEEAFPESNSISIYAVNSATGALTLSGSLAIPGLVPQNIAVSATGFLFVYSGVQPGPDESFSSYNLSTYAIDAPSGMLTPTGTTLTFNATAATGFVTTPDGQWLYVLTGDFADASAPVTVTAYAVSRTTGALTAGPVMTTTSLVVNSSVMAIDPLGRYLYLTGPYPAMSPLGTTVLPYAINSGTGALTGIGSGTPVQTGYVQGLAAEPTGKYLYMTGVSPALDAMAVGQGSGSVSSIETESVTGTIASYIICDPSGQFVYVAQSGTTGDESWSDFLAFTISTTPGSEGLLMPSGGSAPIDGPWGGTGAVSMAVVE